MKARGRPVYTHMYFTESQDLAKWFKVESIGMAMEINESSNKNTVNDTSEARESIPGELFFDRTRKYDDYVECSNRNDHRCVLLP